MSVIEDISSFLPSFPILNRYILFYLYLGDEMVYNKKLFIEVTTLEPIKNMDEFIYKILHRNIPNSYIKINAVGEVTYRDVKE